MWHFTVTNLWDKHILFRTGHVNGSLEVVQDGILIRSLGLDLENLLLIELAREHPCGFVLIDAAHTSIFSVA
jgi:hypothetical protein